MDEGSYIKECTYPTSQSARTGKSAEKYKSENGTIPLRYTYPRLAIHDCSIVAWPDAAMSFQETSARLAALFEAHKHIVHLINRLAKFPTHPGSSTLDSESADARLELGAEIHQNLKEQEEDFEILRQEVDDLTANIGWTSAARARDTEKRKDRTDLATQVTRLGENLKTARSQFRKAQLQAKRNAEAAKRKEREILFASVQESNGSTSHNRRKGQEKLSHDEVLLSTSSDVTVALRRTHALMQTEITKSQFAQETLEQSTAALSTLSESYNNLDHLLSSSRTLVSSLLRSQKSDTWYLESAFWLLVITISWLVFRRILYGPGWWLLYLPANLVWRLLTFNTRVVLSVFATIAGSLGGARESSAILQASERISTTLIVKPSATGDFPRFHPDMPAPSIAVGAGGSGAKAKQPDRPAMKSEQSLSSQVGEMAEATPKDSKEGDGESNERIQGTTLRERGSNEAPNPKKRMWEDNTDLAAEETPRRDEL